jgi:hypothetical protein
MIEPIIKAGLGAREQEAGVDDEITWRYEPDGTAVIAAPPDCDIYALEGPGGLRKLTARLRGEGTTRIVVDLSRAKEVCYNFSAFLALTGRELRAEGGWLAAAAGWTVPAAPPAHMTPRVLAAQVMAQLGVPAYASPADAARAAGQPAAPAAAR